MRYDELSPWEKEDSCCDIAPNAVIGKNVTIGAEVRIGAHTTIMDDVVLEDGCCIGSNCIIGEPLSDWYSSHAEQQARATHLGPGCVIRSGSVLYQGCELGSGVHTGNHVSIREGSRIGSHCSIGSGSDVSDNVVIGDYSRVHAKSHLTAGMRVGKYVWLMGALLTTNDSIPPLFLQEEAPVIGDYSVVCARCLFYPGAELGQHSFVAADSHVKGTFGDYDFIAGQPAKRVFDVRQYFVKHDGEFIYPYPWIKHVERNYPWKDIPRSERNPDEYL